MGFQMVLAIFLAALFGWSKFSAAAGVWITNPFTAPFIYPLTYGVGLQLSGVTKAYNPPTEMSLSLIQKIWQILLKSPEIFWTLVLGGVVLGLPLAVAGYFASYSAVSKYQERAQRRKNRKKLLLEKNKIHKN